MKRLFMIIFVSLLGLIAIQSSAYGSQWKISPNGEIDVSGESQFTIDLIYENTEDDWFSAITWDTDLWLDLTELTPHFNPDEPQSPLDPLYGYSVDYVYEDVNGESFGGTSINLGVLYEDRSTFLVSGCTLGPAIWMSPNDEYTMATITFDILSPDMLNGLVEADIIALDNETSGPYRGFQMEDGSRYYGDPSTDNPDIAVVPVPAAVWLLGSGLVALVGIRRRKA